MAQPYAPLLQQMLLEFQNQRLESTERIAQSILRINPKDLVVLQVFGLALAMQGRLLEAVSLLTRAAALDAKNPELLSNLAKAQHGANLFSDAVQTFEKLNRLVPNNAHILTDMGTSYGKLRQYEKAGACYDKALSLAPNYFLAWSNRGNLLLEQGLPEQAIASYETALQHNSEYAETWMNYGNAFFELGRFDDARQAHERALSINPVYGEAWSNHGNAMQELKRSDDALLSYQRAYELIPTHPFLIGQLLNAYSSNCDWKQSEPLIPLAIEVVGQSKAAVPPFVLLQTPASLAMQQRAAQTFIQERLPVVSPNKLSIKHPTEGRKIRIAYFSTDFKEHPVGILMENLIRLHDRSRFEVLGIFLAKRTDDALEARLAKTFDHTIDIFGINDQQAQKLLLEQDIDIAIDLNGHTAGARTGLFARKIAPLQMNYLGYAGTSGADFYDYLIADQVTIPPEHQIHYTEKVAYLPHSFFPADTLISHEQMGALPTRLSQDLPEEGFVFASFNNAYKITPAIFSVWMDLLKQVPNSVLWLSKPSDSAALHLRTQALSHGIDPEHIIFAKRVPARVDHLSRLRLADLFLDTMYFNAHTTAADALWAGVPVLTIQGDTFASRVAASQLTALRMSDLITHSIEEYAAKALELASDHAKLKSIRYQQEMNRTTAPLFDTKQYVIDLESLYINSLQEKS
ncbi:tetratricopeptide repeat protein [Polynucleobacter sp. UK-Kesae-W10]|uniref:O-linked N-acetylglucosamine transferase, SPINDLY family protein n=1 Tax=Polynucleobacter sp. UK-Kesae-W10 TaxID=1819738 RepID=UPI001C0D9A2E|nr:tetratricopeptide repeat protein [Polynucleobacter sp. UK-Kesae-W10]MBU3578034.1 tetratricopeptide repeat protein [Polynucleobacter sp. UK-Kesae-W10]